MIEAETMDVDDGSRKGEDDGSRKGEDDGSRKGEDDGTREREDDGTREGKDDLTKEGEDDGRLFKEDPLLKPSIEAEAMKGAGEGEIDGNIRLDPFLQPPILKAFFEVLPLEDLAKCRLVSKLWKKGSLSTWRSKASLKIGKEGIVSTRADGSRRITSLEEFLDLWEAGDWGSCPFKQFEFYSWTFEAGDLEQERFLKLVGCHITSLTLVECSFVGRDNFRRIIYQAFQKLKFLEMNSCDVDGDRYYSYPDEIIGYTEPVFGVHELKSLAISFCHPHSLMDMLSHFHKIKSLKLDLSDVDLDDHRNLLEAIRLIRAQDHSKLPLKTFDIDFYFWYGKRETTASSMERLRLHEQLNLPLQRLTIHNELDADESMDCNVKDVIKKLLQHHSSTLKFLEFEQVGPPGLWQSLPFGICLENLELLAIQQSPSFSGNLNYLKLTPNLGFLTIYDSHLSMADSDNLFSNSTQLEIGDWTLPSLTYLAFEVPLCVGNLKKLMKWMPNVEYVKLKLDDVKFPMVCNAWKNLKELVDMGEELTDAGVIGSENASGAGGGEETQIFPITKLENLTTFGTRSSKLTSASIHEGFSKLADLDFLTLGRATKLDDEAKASLETRKIRWNLTAQLESGDLI